MGDAVTDPDALARLLQDHGPAARSGHFAPARPEADPAAVTATARALGIRWVVAPFLAPDERPGEDTGWRALGDRLALIAERLARDDVRLARHNLDFEPTPLPDGSCGLDHLIDTDRGIASEADLAWIAPAGADPLAHLRRHSGQVPLVHVEDRAPEGTAADPGHGRMDRPAPWAAALEAGAEIMAPEHDELADLDRFAGRVIEAMRATGA